MPVGRHIVHVMEGERGMNPERLKLKRIATALGSRVQKDPSRDAQLTRRLHALLSRPEVWPSVFPVVQVDVRFLDVRFLSPAGTKE
jgi:hypothetical protein